MGRPPYQPDDYIDVYVENDRVYVDLDQRLSAPPRLTAAEAAALAAAAELLRPAASEALESALRKLEKVIPPQARERYREMNRKIDAGPAAPSELAPLVPGGGRSPRGGVRLLQPWPRLDRAPRGEARSSSSATAGSGTSPRSATRAGTSGSSASTGSRTSWPTERNFEPSQSRQAVIPNPAQGGEVRVRFSRVVAPYVLERFGDDARPAPEGAVEVWVSGESERWLTQWVLSFGGEAEVIEPEEARRAVARAAEASVKS